MRSSPRRWHERHPGWVLFLFIVCGPFVIWGIAAALLMLALVLPTGAGNAFAAGVIGLMPIAYIVGIVMMVRWYRDTRE